MLLAQHKHSDRELETNRVQFYLRFERIRAVLAQPHLNYRPTYEYARDTIIETQFTP